MERQAPQLIPKPLDLTYEDYEKRQSSIKNLVIDKYVVYDQIGQGSYGSVYRGMDDESKKQVAVKLIDMRKTKNQPNQVVRAIKLRLAESQPRLMYMCDSPYLLKCYDLYENQDLKILIIEYCNGTTLQEQIDSKLRIPENQAWIILKHIINGLMVLHSFKIVHRDLKAENIMSHNGTYKIIDFGFSKKLQITQQSSQVRNTSLGTITTMAPEVMGRKPYGLKADIWSLGIIFFQMIYGKYPYDSVTAAQMYRDIQTKKLFVKPEPFTFNGFTPTLDAYKFLQFTVVVQTEKRPNWKAVSEYPNIKNANDQDMLSQRFLKQCDVVVNLKLDCDQLIREQSEIGNAFKKDQSPKRQEQKPEPVKLKVEPKVEQKIQQKVEQKKGNDSIKTTYVPLSYPTFEQKPEPIKKVQAKKQVPSPKKELDRWEVPQEQKKVQPKKQIPSPKKQQSRQEVPQAQKKEQVKPQPKTVDPPKKRRFNLEENIKQDQERQRLKKQREAQRLKIQKQKQQQNKIKMVNQTVFKIDTGKKQAPKKPVVQPANNVRKLNLEQINIKQKQIRQDDQQQYEWTQTAHLQCLKTIFIFREIITPLQVANILDKQDRTTIQFYYLLCVRCFNNMSPIQDELQQRNRKGKNKELINNLREQIEPLYKQVQTKFNHLSGKLTQLQNRKTSMIYDWFSKKLASNNFQQRELYFTGIETLEYSKEDQIDYTYRYYIQQIKKHLSNPKNLSGVINKLDKYQKIIKVKLANLRQWNKNFKQYTQMVLNTTL